MKSVLIVFPGLHLDIDEGAKHRLNCHIEEYNSRGDKVTVLAFCKSGLFVKNRSKFMNPNAKWICLPYILPISRNIILSKILEIYLGIILMLVSWFHRYDIIQMEIQNIRNRFCRASVFITDIHGDAVHEEVEPKSKSYTDWFVKYLFYLQNKIVKDSDYCIVVSDNLKKQIEVNTKGVIEHSSVISCGVNYEKFSLAVKPLVTCDLKGRLVLGYSGGLQSWQNFDKMVNIVIELRKSLPEVFFLVYTNNSIEPYIDLLNKLGKDNYRVLGLTPQEIPGYLKIFDTGFLLRENQVLNKVSSPTKICEYLAAGVPMICTRYSGDYERSVSDSNTGFIINDVIITNSEMTSLKEWLLDIKHNRGKYYESCQKAASLRTFNEEFEQFYRHISKLYFAE